MPVVIEFNCEDIIRRFEERNSLAVAALSQQILKDSNFYCPLDQGTLQSSALISSDSDRGVITWNTPYAARLYYGIDFNFDKNDEKVRAINNRGEILVMNYFLKNIV